MKAETKSLWEYVNSKDEVMLQEVRKEEILQEDEAKDVNQKRLHYQRVNGFKEKSLHGKFRSSTEEVADIRSWECLKMGYMKKWDGSADNNCTSSSNSAADVFRRALEI